MNRLAGFSTFFLAAASAHAAPTLKTKTFGQLVKVTRDTPVFVEPRAKSKVAADVGEGALLVLRRISPQGTWLLLEDEDFQRGWIPRNRTDFIAVTVDRVEDEKGRGTRESENGGPFRQDREGDAASRAPEPEPPSGAAAEASGGWNELAVFSRLTNERISHDPNGGRAYGVSYARLFRGPHWTPPGGTARTALLGIQVGWALAYRDGERAGWTLPVRYRMLGRENGSSFAYGPDMTVYYFRVNPGFSRWSWGFGYSWGWVPEYGRLMALARLGAEFFNSARLSLEFTLGFKI